MPFPGPVDPWGDNLIGRTGTTTVNVPLTDGTSYVWPENQQLANDMANARIDNAQLQANYQPGAAIAVDMTRLEQYAAMYAGLKLQPRPKPKPIEEVEEVPGRKARLVNKFLVGCDPEFVTIHNGKRCNVNDHLPHEGVVGWDHGGRIAEIRPDPSRGIYRLIKTMQKVLLEEPTLQQLVHRKWRAGAVYSDGNTIESLGGHIHIDIPWDKKEGPVKALDALTRKLEALDILPKDESNDRRKNRGYGRYGDVRPVGGGYQVEAGRIEYRTMASWLFNPAIAFVCLSGAKLAAHAPDSTMVALKGPTSYKQLIKFFELFQGKDDNADRVLEKVLDKGNLKAEPDANVREAWERLGF